ncbi:Cell cycle protein FtsW/RodA [Acididesulfobacillus acetoxydans]|uniref:Probable peptidoglycan glycosyltransferase FtsW n=1 Tax=Acididesulfobacillus acetoxydans TaxID=1561005 RepID=A0A8S0WZL8_9FIRM|nr:putative lipid II flippase FtsW [Acididesulfobacillus acetoxydans]CAA7602031.1 Cell cycle protein FtsW/RodA [Acididesulfobacillus acetoxydans]CEJ08126.1 Lipid II flippase FtsW [Acididesulfobacillus acetoxydans]
MQERRQNRTRANKRVLPAPQGLDFALVFLSVALLAFGLIMVLSSGAVNAFDITHDSYYYLFQQLKWTGLGGALAVIAVMVPFTFWRRLAGVGMLVTYVLLILVLYTHAGIVTSGSARWLRIAGLSIQPSEIAKLSVILFFAHTLERYPARKLRDLAVPLAALLPVLFLIYKQPDLGTMLVLLFTAGAMFLQTDLAAGWFAVALPAAGILGTILVRHQPYQWKRILVWLNPWAYPNAGYQITNAEIALGSGGLFGVGLGRSMQKYGFLPANHTDTIFAIVGEELGLAGALALIILFALWIVRGFQIARSCPDRFGRLLAFGITSSLAVQAAMNLAVVTGVIPVTGVTLPLISYGGNSLLITLVELGILLNISRYRTLPQSRKSAGRTSGHSGLSQ